MQFTSIATLIDSIIEAEVHKKQSKKPTVFLYVLSKDPLTFEDASKVKLGVSENDLSTYLSSYDKISAETTVSL
jgi:hypothetical protein